MEGSSEEMAARAEGFPGAGQMLRTVTVCGAPVAEALRARALAGLKGSALNSDVSAAGPAARDTAAVRRILSCTRGFRKRVAKAFSTYKNRIWRACYE